MATWIYFVLMAQFIWSITSLIDKFVLEKHYIKNPMVYIVLHGLMNVLILFLFPFVWFEPISFFDFLIALASSASVVIGIILYYRALQFEEVSRVIILWQTVPIFTLLLSFLLLDELLTKNHFLGFIFLVLGGVIISYKKTNDAFKMSTAVYYMVLSAFFIGLAYVAAKHVFSITSFWSGVLWLRLTQFVALSALLAPKIRREFTSTFKNMKKTIIWLLVFKVIIDFTAFVLSDYAILLGPVALVSALSSASEPVFVFILALITSIYLPTIIKEDVSKESILTKIAAILLIIAGILFVNL